MLAVPHADIVDDADADFFALGGNSLRAAMLVSRLRRVDGLPPLAVRDVYAVRTLAGLRELIRNRAVADVERAPSPARETVALSTALGFTFAQSLFAAAMSALAAAAGYVLAFVVLPWMLREWSIASLLLALPWIGAGLAAIGGLLSASVAVLAKRLLIGRYRAGSWSAWSTFRLRHWLVVNLARLAPWGMAGGTELHSVLLRAFGARVGRRVHLHRGVDLSGGGWDLLDVGDDVALGRDVDLGLCELDDGQLVVGQVAIGARATLETRAGTGPDVVVGEDALVRPLTFVAAGERVPAAETWDGVPAQRVGDAPTDEPLRGASWRYTVIVLAMRLLAGPLLAMPFALLAIALAGAFDIDSEAVRVWLCVDGPWSRPELAWALVALAVLVLPLWLLELALLLRWLPKVPVGACARWSLRWWWADLRMHWLEWAGEWLSGTLFWPWWLRLAGMRVDADVEVSTILDVLPEHVALGGGSFLADGVYLGVPRVRCGRVTFAPSSLGSGTFVGNHVVVEGGQRLPDDLLLGISTVADARRMCAHTSWFGHPAFSLPQREVVAVDRRLTYEPGPLRYANRLAWEASRMLLPALPVVLMLSWFDLVAGAVGVVAELWAAALATVGFAAVMPLTVLAAKWLLLGRVRPGQHGLWSCWASRWDFHYVMWQRYARGLLQPFEGTLLLPWYLRAMGMRIGRRCVLGDGFAQIVDPDMIAIEDGATVHALFQAHSFEDRVLKIDRVRLGAHCTVGKAAVVLYGADIGEGTHVMPHSVVMKRESLLPDRRYAGAPTAELSPAFRHRR